MRNAATVCSERPLTRLPARPQCKRARSSLRDPKRLRTTLTVQLPAGAPWGAFLLGLRAAIGAGELEAAAAAQAGVGAWAPLPVAYNDTAQQAVCVPGLGGTGCATEWAPATLLPIPVLGPSAPLS